MGIMRTASFRGTKYDVDLCGPVDGTTDNPKMGGRPRLMICTSLDERRGLETVIHEALYACSFLKDEETARDLARFLWRLDYRHARGELR